MKHFLTVLWFGIALIGCGSAQTEAVNASVKLSREQCQSRALDIVAAASTCLSAEAQLNALAVKSPECVVVLGGQVFGHYCDGGTE